MLRRFFPFVERDLRIGAEANPFFRDPPEWEGPGSGYRLGIVIEPFQHHKHYIAACRELGISYRLIDLCRDDWVACVRDSVCDAFLVWPSMSRRALRDLFDDRLRILEEDLGRRVYPSLRETWLYENKCRTRDWLEAYDIPHPPTRLFYQRRAAMAFAQNAELPLVVKTRLGAASNGVWIVHTRQRLRWWIWKSFFSGLVARMRHFSEAEAGFILLQTHLPRVKEWRMVRIGDSFFGHQKGEKGGFHSGSGLVDWSSPSEKHLDFLLRVTDTGGFRSMDVDLFETEEGDLLVNELQTVFGAAVSVDQMKVDGKTGRYVRDDGARSWRFEEGDFARNACCNARVLDLLRILEGEKDA